MDLSEFVQQSLVQIVEGVKASQEIIRERGGFANPAVFTSAYGQDGHFGSVSDGHNVLLVDFDVAVTVADASEGSAGAKLSVAALFKAETGGNVRSTTESVSRLRFKVPLALPLDEASKQRLDQAVAHTQARIRDHSY